MTYKYVVTREHNHVQSVADTNWVIDFPFKAVPVVDVLVEVNGELTKVLPSEVNRVSDTRVEIIFSQPFSGSAHLVG
jgi:hypothetical protein